MINGPSPSHCSVKFSSALAMRLLVVTIIVILQGSFHGAEFVLLKTEAEEDTGTMEDGGDYQDNPTMDVSNQNTAFSGPPFGLPFPNSKSMDSQLSLKKK